MSGVEARLALRRLRRSRASDGGDDEADDDDDDDNRGDGAREETYEAESASWPLSSSSTLCSSLSGDKSP